MKLHALIPAALCLSAAASAQSTVFGIDLRGDQFFSTDTAQFVTNFTNVGVQTRPIYAMDFDASASTLWAIQNDTQEIGTIDIATGVFTAVGQATGGFDSVSGLTASPDGTTWYLSDPVSGDTNLYVGDIMTGVFQLVGPIGAGLIIDISMDSQGNLYGNSISDDSLYSIDTSTGVGTLIGPTGFGTNFAQGMDFDWSTDTLYATLYTGGGTGVFASIDLATGAATQLDDTTPTNAEMEITIQQGISGIGVSYCGPAVANSTGSSAEISASGSAVASDNNLTLTADILPTNAFGFFLTSMTQGLVMGPGGSQGNLCLGGSIGRYVGPGQIQNSGATGSFSLALDLTQHPTPMGFVTVMGGQTWNFQAWYRDSVGGMATSNFTDGLSISFQ